MTRRDLAIRMMQVFDQEPGTAVDGMMAALKVAENELCPAVDDHLGRSDKDFAIEFGRYLADEAERFMEHYDSREYMTEATAVEGAERWNALLSAIYEFRKRAKKAAAMEERLS